MITYHAKLNFTESVLGSAACDPEVYKRFIADGLAKREIALAAVAAAAGGEVATPAEELATLPPEIAEEKGWTVFHRDSNGLFIYDYNIRGFLKSALDAVTPKTTLPAGKSKIDKWVFVFPRRLYFMRDGGPLGSPDGVLERPLRAMTMQGPRVTVARSDRLDPPLGVGFELRIVDKGAREITEDLLRSWLEYGSLQGLSQWRNGGYGRFGFELQKAAE